MEVNIMRNLEKNSNRKNDYMEEHLSKILEDRIAKQKNLASAKEQHAKKYVRSIVELFNKSTQESIDFNLDTLIIYHRDGALQLCWKSPLIDGIEYYLDDNDIYDHMSILKNMPNTRQKMREIESILPTQSAISDIHAIFQQEPFNKYFETEEFATALYITFKS